MASSPPRKAWFTWAKMPSLPHWLQRKGNRDAEAASPVSLLQKELEEQQARLRKQMEEVTIRLDPPPGGHGGGAPGSEVPPPIWHVEKAEDSYDRPIPTGPVRGRLGVQRRIERNRFLVIACVLIVVAIIFYKVMS